MSQSCRRRFETRYVAFYLAAGCGDKVGRIGFNPRSLGCYSTALPLGHYLDFQRRLRRLSVPLKPQRHLGGGGGEAPPPPFKGARLVVRTRRWRDCPLVRDRGSGGRRGPGRCPEGAVHARVGEGQAGPPEATHSAAEGTPVPLAAAGGPRGAGLEGGPWCRQSGYWWLGQPRRGPVWRFQTGWWAAGSGRRHWYPRAFWVACRQGVGGHELGHQRAVTDGGWAVAGGGWTVTDGGGARPSGAAQRSTTKEKDKTAQ